MHVYVYVYVSVYVYVCVCACVCVCVCGGVGGGVVKGGEEGAKGRMEDEVNGGGRV